MKGSIKRILSWLLTAALLMGLVPVVAGAAETETNVAVWGNMVDNTNGGQNKMPIPINATGGSLKEGAQLTRGGAGTPDPTEGTVYIHSTKSSQTVYTGSWTANDSYWQIKFSTKGITKDLLVVRAGQYSTSKGPKHFQAKYSLDGTTFTDIGEPYAVQSDKVNTPSLNITLPDTLKDQDMVYIRLYPTDGTTGGSNNSRIHDIYVVNAPIPTTCDTPVADLNKGSTVPVGGKVHVTSPTEGATLQIKVGEAADWENFDGTITFPAVPSESTDGTYTYTAQVQAIKEPDLDASTPLELSYTVFAPDALSNNDSKVVLYHPNSSNALTGNASGKKLAGVAGTVAEGKLTTTGDALKLTPQLGADGFYRFVTDDSKYLTTGATGNSLSLSDTETEYSLWALEETETAGNYYIHSVNARSSGKPQYLEFYNGFTTFGISNTVANYTFQFFTEENVVVSSTPDDPPEKATLPATGDYAIWAHAYHQAVSSTKNDKGYLLGETVTENDTGNLYGLASTAIWTVTRTDDGTTTDSGTYTIAQGGKYLGATAAEGGKLTWAESPAVSEWTIEVNGTTLNMKCGGKYLEWYAKQSDWSLYGSSAGDDYYNLTFTPAAQVVLPEVSTFTTDEDVEQAIASWGGSTPAYDALSDKNTIHGDLYKSGDLLDSAASFTVRANGAPAQAYQKTTAGNYFMGGENIGAKAGDYMEFAVNTSNYADMTLSFRLRATDAAPGSFHLQYSADNGATFKSFLTGSYSYSYTKYVQGEPTEDKGSGTISDGAAPTSKAPRQYITFTFDVPAGAENQSKLLIRLAAGTERADGKTGSDNPIAGNIRIDSVVLSGHPITGDGFTQYVTVTPDNETDQAPGTELTLSCATAGAAISYRFVNPEDGQVVSDWAAYDEAAKPQLPASLPTVLEAKATAGGKESITRMWVYAAGTVAAVKMSPNGGGVYFGDQESIAVTLSCDTEGATIYYSINSEDPEQYEAYTAPIVLNKAGFADTTIRAYATKTGFTDSAVTARTFTLRESAEYGLYFGQIHSHTNYSDGAGTCEEAFNHAKGLSDAWNIDFLAVTDHSNSFDNADSASLADGSKSTEWTEGHTLADKASDTTFTGIYGFEMTWSNGLGHINTFNTPGFQSRTQARYTTYGTALQNYYADLKTQSDSISQFNHPGTTFGDFSDFAHYDEEIDALITTIEVGNGEGAIGSSGYFPSYEYYTRALDKGWHVAPTNNQDNHKGNWGDSNTGRTVVLADSIARDDIYDALRNYRVYATEDLNLEIRYTLDGSDMGAILDGAAGETAHAKVALKDVDDSGEATVQVIVNGGLVAAEKKATCNETVEFDVPTTYAYYYIKVVQADGDIAVTAPVWLGKVEAVGVSAMTAGSDLTVVGQEQTITLDLYNNEQKNFEVTSVVFTDKATGAVLADNSTVDTPITRVKKLGTASCSFTHTFTTDGVVTVLATVKGTLGGVEKTYTKELELTVMPAEMVRKVIVDGTHYNDYVTGYYGGRMNNMVSLAADVGVQVEIVTDSITADKLTDCALLIISAPARAEGSDNAGAYVPSQFDDAFIQMVKNYVDGGGKVAVCGLADYQDKKAADADHHISAQLNKLLAAIGSSMKINDDEVYDTVNNGGQAYRLYPETFNMDSKWTRGIVTADQVKEGENYQKYSQYSGCSVDPGSGEWLVKGFDTTYSIDSDNDGVGGIAENSGKPVYCLAAETVGANGGTVFAAGSVFLSDFEVKAELDNIWDLPYANRTIFENILSAVRENVKATPIDQIRAAEKNKMFVAEGYVTNGTQDEHTKFFDAIYIQDDTGGITVFPYSTMGLAIGTKVQVIGYTDDYQGDKEIQVTSLMVLDAEPHVYEPTVLTTAQAADYDAYGGLLVKTSGVVSDIVQDGGVVSQFKLTDESGTPTTVFIDGYITNPAGRNSIASWIREGQTVSAVGLSYLHPEGNSDVGVPVLRVRNCDEVVGPPAPAVPAKPSAATETVENEDGSVTTTVTSPDGTVTQTTVRPDGQKSETVTTPAGDVSVTVTDPQGEELVSLRLPANVPAPEQGFVDVPDTHWAARHINDAAALGLVKGVDDAAHIFDTNSPMTRGGVATVLFRLSNGKTDLTAAFEDVTRGAWYADAVGWGAANGILEGYSAQVFAPEDSITREQMAVLLRRYAKLLGLDTKADPAALSAFTDAGDADGWAADGLAWCVQAGILQGYGDGRLDPLADATRAEAVTMLDRFLDLLR